MLTRVTIVFLMLMLVACGGGKAVAPIGKYFSNDQKKTAPKYYIVKKGDTLYSISWRYGMDFKTVARFNGIKSPYTIYVGQKIGFSPKAKIKKSTKAKTRQRTKKVTQKSNVKTKSKSVTNKHHQSRLSWQWPIKGAIISTYSSQVASRKGIKIAGKSGQNVVATAAGKVVYSGNGLPRYGNLVIIKHNESYLSAYAHNKDLLVQEGQQVKAGQKIALLGRTGTQRDQLHFEIRHNGKPVDPMRFLPKR